MKWCDRANNEYVVCMHAMMLRWGVSVRKIESGSATASDDHDGIHSDNEYGRAGGCKLGERVW